MSTASHTYRYGLFSWTVRGEIAKPRRETDARSRAGRGVLKKCVEGLSDEPVGLATQFVAWCVAPALARSSTIQSILVRE